MNNLNKLGIKNAHDGLKKKEFSSVELTEAVFSEIEARDGEIGAYLALDRDRALETAKKVDRLIAYDQPIDLLSGIPVAVKDVISTKGIKTTAGSKILEDYMPVYDATAIKKIRDQNAVIIGKTNCDEFAQGSSTENSAFKITRNPCDVSRVPGGTSGGSAAAVAADMCIYALGSDTGGSVRQPAALCGVVGLKPTYGRVSRYGLIATASSLDTVGTITKTAEDAALVLEAIAGHDPLDGTSSREKVGKFGVIGEMKKLRVGVPKEYFGEGIERGVKKTLEDALVKLGELGAEIIEVSIPSQQYALAVYYVINPSEISSNMARFDAVRYGKDRSYFGDEVKRRIMLGTFALSSGYYDQYYNKANKVRALIKRDFDAALGKVDVIIGPTSPTVAWKLGEKMDDPMQMYLSDIYTITANLIGSPAISIPCGESEGLPVGLQIMGQQFKEEKILQVAYAYEQTRT